MRKWVSEGIAITFALVISTAAMADWIVPGRGTQVRKSLMDALRPHAEWQLGKPVEFVVKDIRLAGGVAYASVIAQRPGGGSINIHNTPGFARGALDPDYMDGTTLQALYRKVGETWVAVHWAIGATDVWFAHSDYCLEYFEVIPEVCAG